MLENVPQPVDPSVHEKQCSDAFTIGMVMGIVMGILIGVMAGWIIWG